MAARRAKGSPPAAARRANDPFAIRFFAGPAAFRAWLATHHRRAPVLWVGFYKKASGKPSITWPESVDEALCYGWIDGIRKSLGAESYTIRFTPRRAGSIWSAVNVKRVAVLTREGRMRAAGLRAFEGRTPAKTAVYSYEQRGDPTLAPAFVREFKRARAAWEYFSARPPGYRRTAVRWVMSAKRDETRRARLRTLIADSEARRHIAPLRRPVGPAAT